MQEQQEETRIFFQCELTGCAADMVMNKIKEKQHGGISKFGKQRAVQALLCELWQKKNQGK